MLWHAITASARFKKGTFERYVREKEARQSSVGSLTATVFGRRVFIRYDTLLVVAFGDKDRVRATEETLRGLAKDGNAFAFSKTGQESSAGKLPEIPGKNGFLWLLHANATKGFEQMLRCHGFTPTTNTCMTIWAPQNNVRLSMVAVSRRNSMLIVGTDRNDVREVGLLVGITRFPEKLERPPRIPREILRSQSRVAEPLLS